MHMLIEMHCYIIQIYSGITRGRVLNGELLYTQILDVNLFASAYRLFHEDFSSIYEGYNIALLHYIPRKWERNLHETV